MAVGDVTSNKVGSGARFNDGKVRYDLIPTHLLESTANVLEFGAKKYAPWNWAKGMPYSVVIGCLKRHMAAIERGEDIDPETGQRHTGHMQCNLLFLEHYMNAYPEMDDRPTEWFGVTKKEDNDGDKLQTDCGQACEPALYTMVERGVSDLRTYVQPPTTPTTFIGYFDGTEYWRDSNGSLVRYDPTSPDFSG